MDSLCFFGPQKFLNSQALPERLPRLSPGACREAKGVWCWGFVDGGNLQGSIYFP